MIKNPFHKSYYKYRIVLTFSLVTILLVTVLARVSYVLVKELYLSQISSNVNKTIQLTAAQLDKTYFDFLEAGITTKSTKKYFHDFFRKSNFSELYSEIFILDNLLNVVIHSDSTKKNNTAEPRLLLNQDEIFSLNINNSISSLPFKGDDDKWYLWGFYRLSGKHWLAVKESASNFEKVEQLSSVIWYFGLAGILFSIILGILVSNSITKPIRKLISFSNEIGLGNLSAKVPSQMKGELNILSNALDTMRNNIANNQKEKEMILAQIAHEIRNPLGGIELLTNLISESNSDKAKNDEYTKRILSEISELKKLISSYLNYSRPTIPVLENVKLNELIDESVSIFNHDLKENNITITTKYGLDNITFDRTHLKSVLINLVKNSIESLEENGEIVIETFKKNKMGYITVWDSGQGIKADEIELVFDPFYTTKLNGTGLGLSSCKKYCLDNVAELRVEYLDNGCKFTIAKEI